MNRRAEEGRRRRLSTGVDRLDQWSENASQAERNAVYKALFAVLCGSVFRSYPVVTGTDRPEEYVVRVRPDLVIRIRLAAGDAFGIAYIGAPQPAAGQDRVA